MPRPREVSMVLFYRLELAFVSSRSIAQPPSQQEGPVRQHGTVGALGRTRHAAECAIWCVGRERAVCQNENARSRSGAFTVARCRSSYGYGHEKQRDIGVCCAAIRGVISIACSLFAVEIRRSLP